MTRYAKPNANVFKLLQCNSSLAVAVAPLEKNMRKSFTRVSRAVVSEQQFCALERAVGVLRLLRYKLPTLNAGNKNPVKEQSNDIRGVRALTF